MQVKRCRDVSRNVSTRIEPRQQQRQCTVGLPPHQAVDGYQFRGRPFDASTLLSNLELRDLGRSGAGGHQDKTRYDSYDNCQTFHVCKDIEKK